MSEITGTVRQSFELPAANDADLVERFVLEGWAERGLVSWRASRLLSTGTWVVTVVTERKSGLPSAEKLVWLVQAYEDSHPRRLVGVCSTKRRAMVYAEMDMDMVAGVGAPMWEEFGCVGWVRTIDGVGTIYQVTSDPLDPGEDDGAYEEAEL